MQTPTGFADFIWDIAELLRGDYKRSDYGKVILPLTVLRRLDCTLEKTRQAVRDEIRRWILENDWLEGIIALPDQLFYNTGISTYVWIVSSRKSEHRRGKVQFVNAAGFWQPMKKSLGNKRKRIGDGADGRENQIARIVQT